MKIAIAQTTSHGDLEINLAAMEKWTVEAKRQGCQLIVFPEMAYFSGKKDHWKPISKQFSQTVKWFCDLAQKHSIALVPGTLREPCTIPDKFFNTLLFIDSSGKILAHYRKLFLYRANLSDRNYDETEYSAEGSEIVTLEWRGLTFGLSICFDLRFPELFRSLKKRGAQIILLPSAFTVPTGQAHWEVLIRARAIENQVFFLAPGLSGISGDGSAKYGHSLIVNPWGEVKKDLKESEGIETFEIDLSEIAQAENKIPAWSCRREELFKIS